MILALKTNCVNVFSEENRSNNKIKTKFHFTDMCVCVCVTVLYILYVFSWQSLVLSALFI